MGEQFLINLLIQLPVVAALLWFIREQQRDHRQFVHDLLTEYQEREKRREQNYQQMLNIVIDALRKNGKELPQ